MSGAFFIVERFSLCISFLLSDYMYLKLTPISVFGLPLQS
jgi:hypothetical protein